MVCPCRTRQLAESYCMLVHYVRSMKWFGKLGAGGDPCLVVADDIKDENLYYYRLFKAV